VGEWVSESVCTQLNFTMYNKQHTTISHSQAVRQAVSGNQADSQSQAQQSRNAPHLSPSQLYSLALSSRSSRFAAHTRGENGGAARLGRSTRREKSSARAARGGPLRRRPRHWPRPMRGRECDRDGLGGGR
jgi:hypothetical protein